MSYNMDQRADLPLHLDQEFNDLLTVLWDDICGPTPPPAPSRPIVPSGMDGCTPLGAAPHRFEQLNTSMAPQRLNVGPGPLYNQAASYSQGQNLPIFYHVPSAAATGYPAAPPQPYNNVPVVQDLIQNLPIAGVLNGQVLYKLPDSFSSVNSAAPPPKTVTTKKRKREGQHTEGPYVKKPANAFMLFMKEQRPNVVAEINTSRGMAVVNTILGQKWKSLSNDEQAKYYQKADIERRLHAERHPDWSNSNNYGVKRKRSRSRAANMAEASTSGVVTQQTKKRCVTSRNTGVVEAPPTHTYVTEPPTQKASEMETIQVQHPYTDPLVTVDVSSFTQLLAECGSFCLDSTTTASTAMESPAAPAELDDLDLANELEALINGLMEKENITFC